LWRALDVRRAVQAVRARDARPLSLRFLIVVGGVCGITWFARAWVDTAALGISFAATQLLLQIVMADGFMKLATASSPLQARAAAGEVLVIRFSDPAVLRQERRHDEGRMRRQLA